MNNTDNNTTNNNNVYRTHRTQLKCLLLGAAGAGKTSLLRRYFYHTFEVGTRVPTRGSDFYVGTLSETLEVVPENDDDVEDDAVQEFNVDINLQLWDTPGRERQQQQQHRSYNNKLSDQFLVTADAVMLVYDMTSSTSFTTLLRWYADLQEACLGHMPILVVGNKLDRAAQQNDSTGGGGGSRRRRVDQRDVLGLAGTGFRGQDFQYEYRVSPIRKATSTNNTTTTTTSTHKNRHQHRAESSSFLANRENNWTADNSYLDSLLNSEDESHPDRDMVLLWCMRNELTHLEVSAATGAGVDEAVQTLARMALSRKLNAEYEQMQQLQQQEEMIKDTEQQSTINDTTVQGELVTGPAAISLPNNNHHQLDVHQPKRDWYRLNHETSTRCCCFGISPPTLWFQKQ